MGLVDETGREEDVISGNSSRSSVTRGNLERKKQVYESAVSSSFLLVRSLRVCDS